MTAAEVLHSWCFFVWLRGVLQELHVRTVHLDFMDPPAAQVTSFQTGLSKTSFDRLISSAVLVSLVSECTCVHGLCDSGLKGDGRCTCFSGYKGPNCDQGKTLLPAHVVPHLFTVSVV